MRFSTLSLIFLASCGWNQDINSTIYSGDTWNPNNIVSSIDGLYVPLTNGQLVLVSPTKPTVQVEIDGDVTEVLASPDGKNVVAFVRKQYCPSDLELEDLDECPDEKLATDTRLAVINKGVVDTITDIEPSFNTVTFAPDGRTAIAGVDFDRNLNVDQVLNLTSVAVIDLKTGKSTSVPIGFAADRVLFTENQSGTATGAVVLSQSAVAVLDLVGDPSRTTVFPLTLDPSNPVQPVDVVITPDGEYALITASGFSELFVLDLVNRSINLIELAGVPADLLVDEATDQTVIVYKNKAVVEVLDHQRFDITTADLDEPANTIHRVANEFLLCGSGHEAYKFNVETQKITDYLFQNPQINTFVSPDPRYAVAFTSSERNSPSGGIGVIYDANPGMEIIDLEEDDTLPFLLQGTGLGLAYSQGNTSLTALVLQQGVSYLYALNLYTGEGEELDLLAPPVRIGAITNGPFFVTHNSLGGLVSFLDPDTNEITTVSGFALTNWLEE